MTILVGDVVSWGGQRWAVLELTRATPSGSLAAKLVGRRPVNRNDLTSSKFHSMTVDVNGLVLAETVTFAEGETVKLWDGLPATVVSDGPAIVSVSATRQGRQTAGGQYMSPTTGVTDVARGVLSRDNRL